MISLWSILFIIHVFGLALGVGAATTKLSLLLKCKVDNNFVPLYIKVTRPITRLIIVGLVLLTLSGISWIFMGISFTPLLLVKVTLVALVWVLGPIIDNVVEPRFEELAPAPDENPTPEYLRAQKKYLLLEVIATALFYIITVMGVFL
jgi:hypothetical protein